MGTIKSSPYFKRTVHYGLQNKKGKIKMKLRTIFEIQSVMDSRKLPCDIEEFLETERWCKSKEQ